MPDKKNYGIFERERGYQPKSTATPQSVPAPVINPKSPPPSTSKPPNPPSQKGKK